MIFDEHEDINTCPGELFILPLQCWLKGEVLFFCNTSYACLDFFFLFLFKSIGNKVILLEKDLTRTYVEQLQIMAINVSVANSSWPFPFLWTLWSFLHFFHGILWYHHNCRLPAKMRTTKRLILRMLLSLI